MFALGCRAVHRRRAGFTYIEVLMAMALLTIVMVPVLPALGRAVANQQYAVIRRQAQGEAVALALKAGAAHEDAANIVSRAAESNSEFTYRLTLVAIGGGSPPRVYVSGNADLMPGPTSLNFQTVFTDVYDNGLFVAVEIFDADGNLLGISFGKRN